MKTLGDRIGGLRRVIGGPFGSNLTQADYMPNGVPVIRGLNMEQNGRWIGGKYAFVTAEKAASDLRTNIARAGDIIVTQRGTMGQVSIIPDDSFEKEFIISQSQMAISVDPKCAVRDFVYYYLRSPEFAEYLSHSIIQTGVPHINLSILRQAPAEWPNLGVQQAIAFILATLDDRIELNRLMNETLQAMARAIFKDWFVDFGPTRAKMEGRAPYLAPDIWSLFPDRFDDEGKPKGWKRDQLGEHVLNFDSKRVPVSGGERAKRKGAYPYHGATGVMDYIDAYLFDGIYLLVGEDGSVAKDNGLAFTQYVWGKIWVNNHAHVIQGKGSVSTEQILLYFHHELVTPYITGAVQLKLSQGRMNLMPFMYSGPDLCKVFSKLVVPLFATYRANADENTTLAATRDLLLPKLMSGEIRVRDAEKAVEAAQ